MYTKSKQLLVRALKHKSNSKNIVNITNNNLDSNNKININKINSLKTPIKITHQKTGNNNFNNKLNEQEIYQNYLKISKKTDIEMNSLLYKEAKKIDNRAYFMYYASLIRTNHLLFFSFFPTMDYNSQILKIFLFFFNYTTFFLVNALFFDDKEIYKIYSDGGSFDFIYNLP